VESTKSVSELYAPISGRITEVNDAVDSAPELINSAPYGAGWLFRLAPSDVDQLSGLLSASEYEAMTQGA